MKERDQQQILDLSQRARVFDPSSLDGVPQLLLDLVSKADQDKRLLNIDEIEQLCAWSGMSATALIQLQNQTEALLNQARHNLLSQRPELTRPGGDLHPEARAQACWHDCFQFLRISFYGVALQRTAITNTSGMLALAELYAYLDVPVPALLTLLDQLIELIKTKGDEAGAGRETTSRSLRETLQHISRMIRISQHREETTSLWHATPVNRKNSARD